MNEIATTIPLTRGYFALIDTTDYKYISLHKWFANKDKYGYVYARTHVPGSGKHGKNISMHRYLMDAKPGEFVDHINGDGLDNRRSNLRICTSRENARNQRSHLDKTTSRFKGVYLNKASGRFRAQIMVDYKKKNLGEFASEEDAATAYNEAALRLHGEFARINRVPSEVPTVAPAIAA